MGTEKENKLERMGHISILISYLFLLLFAYEINSPLMSWGLR